MGIFNRKSTAERVLDTAERSLGAMMPPAKPVRNAVRTGFAGVAAAAGTAAISAAVSSLRKREGTSEDG